MALPNNPTQSEVVKAIKDLETNKADSSALSSYFPKSGGALNSGAVITMTGGNPYLGLKETSGTQYYLQGYQGEVGISVSGSWGTKRISLDSNGKVTIPSKSLSDGTYTYTLPNKTGTVAMTSDIPSAVTESTVSGWGFTKNAGTITGVQLNGKSVASSGVANVQALPNFSLNINHQTGGNPRPVKFLTVNYSSAATYFKMSATSCHDNGTSYQFLEDIIIGCTTSGTVVCNVYKYCQQEVSYDGATRNYGDVFYVIDTTNKIVDFYILCGQWASSQFTPATKIGNTTIAYITQYTGTATYYSSGTKVWADGDSALYVRTGDLKTVNGNSLIGSGDITITAPTPTNIVTTDTNQTVSGVKTFTGGIWVSGRPAGGGDDEGIVVGRAPNNYAGVCLGSPSGMRSVFYLTAANKPVWRWNNGSASFDIEHPAKAGTIALTSDFPFTMTLVANATGTAVDIDTLVNNGTLSASEEYLLIPNNTASPTMGYMQLRNTSGIFGYSHYPIMVRPWYYSKVSAYVFNVEFPNAAADSWYTKTVNYAKIYKITY